VLSAACRHWPRLLRSSGVVTVTPFFKEEKPLLFFVFLLNKKKYNLFV
jgi:hypothetical protein